MVMHAMIRQTAFLSGSHFLVRVMGFILRIWLSRELGAQAMGLVELAGNAQMLLITPVVSGLPAAMSRMCAKAEHERQVRVLRCGMGLALAFSLPLMLIAFALRTPLALWLGDIRTLPALIAYLPCIPVLGVSCALNGYYYGTGRPVPPAVSEILEQVIRLFLTVRLVSTLRGWPVMLRAAAPAAASMIGETIALMLMLLIAARTLLTARAAGSRRMILREMIALSLPLTGMRIVSSLMRTVQSVLIPARLQISGLTASGALGQLGMMNGMMMPVLLLPSFVTCSLTMVAAPELTRRQAQQRPQRHLVLRLIFAALSIGLMAMAGVWILAPLFSNTLYRQPELLPLLRRCCALVPVMAVSQVVSGMMNGLGLQGTSLRITLLSSFLSILTMYVLAAQPALRLWGVIIAFAGSQVVTLILSLRALLRAVD